MNVPKKQDNFRNEIMCVQLDFNTASVIFGLEGQATNRNYMYSTILAGH
jgi:hypothetical protein